MKRLIFGLGCVMTILLPVLAQNRQGSLASLIQRGDRKTATAGAAVRTVCRARRDARGDWQLWCAFLHGHRAAAGDWHQDGARRARCRCAATCVGPIHATDGSWCGVGIDRRLRVDPTDDKFVVWSDSDRGNNICFSFDHPVARRVSCMSDSGETSNESRSFGGITV